MDIVVWVVHVLVALALVGLIMLQHGKGADIGAAFGSGASNTVFGARGSANFLSRTTAILAVVFFITSLTLAYFVSGAPAQQSAVERAATPAADAPTKTDAATEQDLLNQLSQQLQKEPGKDGGAATAPEGAPEPVVPQQQAPKP
jgi:preprotein translocase subunit SecG